MRQKLAGTIALFSVIAIASHTETPQGESWALHNVGGRVRVAWKYPFEAIVTQRQNGIRFADQYSSVQSAVNDAGDTGAIVIPPGVAGDAIFANPMNIPLLDFRRKGAEIGIWSQIAPSRPVADYPLGSDLRLIAHGAADLWLSHNTNDAAKTSTTVSLRADNNRGILVGDTSKFSARAPIWVGRETENEEMIGEGRWSIVDDRHINVTCTKTHTGTTDIEQLGSTILDGGDKIILKSDKPTQLSGRHASVRFFDDSGHPLFYVPGSAADSGPAGTFQMFVPLVLGNGTPISKLQHRRVASCTTRAIAGTTCDTTVAWSQTFEDSNYTVNCNITNVTNQPRIMSLPTKTSAGVAVRIEAVTSAPASGTIECAGLHD